jgi:hypothetical protein
MMVDSVDDGSFSQDEVELVLMQTLRLHFSVDWLEGFSVNLLEV